jgi:hypothetical protein
MNEVFEYEIENLQKHKISEKKNKNCKVFDPFAMKNSAVQTCNFDEMDKKDWMQVLNCFALGLEAFLVKPDLY